MQSLSRFVVYRSSAGSGKTYTLVKEYLKLALHDDRKISKNFKSILALTFTNKAAAEMRNRILSALKEMAISGSDFGLKKDLASELSLSYDELESRSNELLTYILHHYADFSVSTIDSFSHRIIKTFAQDLKLPVNFELQTDTQEFYRRVVSGLINEIGTDSEITALMKDFVFSNIDANSTWDPQQSIEEFVFSIQKENALEHLNKLEYTDEESLNNFRNFRRNFLEDFQNKLRKPAQEALKIIEENGLTAQDFYRGISGPVGLFNKCVLGNLTDDPRNSYVKQTLDTNKWYADSKDKQTKQIIDTISSKLQELLQRINETLDKEWIKYKRYSLLGKQIYPVLLLKKIKQLTDILKKEEQLVFVEEFNTRIHEFIKHEPVNYIYERLGDRYSNFLIDEFQDTSTLQWLNTLPLVHNGLAEGKFNLLVGDGKQSIYRWRNANVTQFMKLPELQGDNKNSELEEQEHALKRNFKEEILNKNFRSFINIVEFNNQIFSTLSEKYLNSFFKEVYSTVKQQIVSQQQGYVQVLYKKLSSSDLENFHCETTLNHINKCLQQGFSYKDVCLITYTNFQGSLLASYLSEKNVPVVSSDSLLITKNAEVNFIISFLRYIVNNHDEVAAASILNHSIILSRIDNSVLTDYLTQIKSKNLFDLLGDIKFDIRQKDFFAMNLLESVHAIISTFSLNSVPGSAIYLQFFLDEVVRFMNKYGTSYSEFLVWWKKQSEKASLVISEELDAVKIMTIHRSKGLEFPVVIVPFCNWQLKVRNAWVSVNDADIPIPAAYLQLGNKAKEAGFATEVEEETAETNLDNLNLLYVAFTRAVQRLYVICGPSENTNRNNISEWIKESIQTYGNFSGEQWLFELGTPLDKIQEKHTQKTKEYLLKPIFFDRNNQTIKIKNSTNDYEKDGLKPEERGILIHQILEQVTYAKDAPEALNYAVVRGIIHRSNISEYREILLQITQDSTLKPYFNEPAIIKKEREFISNSGKVLRPDRICFLNDEVCVIDYKTGKEDKKNHYEQMKEYEEVLISLGYKKIRKILVYISPFKVLEVY